MRTHDDPPDLYLRAVPQGPALPRMGGAYCPDIVPWGEVLDPAPAALAEPPLWDEDPGRPLLPAVFNNVYVRCANATRSDVPGRLYLAVGAASLPCWPDLLKPLPAPGGGDYVPLTVSGGQNATLTTPFKCQPESATDTLAAWLVTRLHKPTPSDALDTVADLKAFLENNAGYAQRSVAFGITGSYTFAAQYQQRNAAADMQLELRCHNCPVGWTLSVLPDRDDGPLRLEPFELTNSSQIVSLIKNVHAKYEDVLTLRIDSHDLPPAPDARVDLVLSVRLPGTTAPPTLFRLGCHSWRAQPPSTDAATRGSTQHRSQP